MRRNEIHSLSPQFTEYVIEFRYCQSLDVGVDVTMALCFVAVVKQDCM